MKDLKQRYCRSLALTTCISGFAIHKTARAVVQSQWYNRRQGRKGTLWEDRYKSVLVEGDSKALMTMAAYIDLN